MDEENKQLKSKLEEKEKEEKTFQHQTKELHRKMDDLHSQVRFDTSLVRDIRCCIVCYT